MRPAREKKQVFRSLMEFEKQFLPKSFAKKKEKARMDADTLGTNFAKESLDKIMKKLK